GGVRGHPGHLAELHAGRDFSHLSRPLRSHAVNVGPARNHYEEGVPAPFTFTDDIFARRESEQPHVRPNLFAAVIAAVDDDLEVDLIFVMSFFLSRQIGDGADALDGGQNFSTFCVLLWHRPYRESKQ